MATKIEINDKRKKLNQVNLSDDYIRMLKQIGRGRCADVMCGVTIFERNDVFAGTFSYRIRPSDRIGRAIAKNWRTIAFLLGPKAAR